MKKHQIHDAFIKKWLSDTEVAQAFFAEFLPTSVSNHLQLSTLEPLSTSYVSNDLKSHFSDLVWQVQTRHGPVEISLLLEHKSYRDPKVIFQILGYLAQGYLKQLKSKKKVALIIPILYYHGKKRWKLGLLSDFISEIPPEWRSICPRMI